MMSAPAPSLAEVKRLNQRFASAHPTEIIRWAVETFRPKAALTSSFGARSAGILHLAVQVDPQIDVRFVDTGLLFPETYQFRDELQRRLGLKITTFKTRLDVERFVREHEHLGIGHPDFCCSPHKVEATERALAGLSGWITGITRSDSAARANTPLVEVLTTGLVKVAPLAAWTAKEIHAYLAEHQLPYHPLWEKGYVSIGDVHSTRPLHEVGHIDQTRFSGLKRECGLHEINLAGL